jgi:methyl-accepting chemotaxis protein
MKTTLRLTAVLDRLTVAQRLFAAFAVMLTLSAALGATGILSLLKANEGADALAGKWMTGLGDLAQARTQVVELRANEVRHSKTGDKSYHAEYEAAIKAAEGQLAALMAQVAGRAEGEAERAPLAALDKALAEYAASRAKVLQAGREGSQQDAADFSDGLSAMKFDEAVVALDKLIVAQREGGVAAAAEVDGVLTQAKTVIAAVLAATLVVGIAMALFITGRLRAQLGGEPAVAAAVARAVADGDLSVRVPLRAGDSTSLMACMAAMQKSLTDTVARVRAGSEQVATASAQIAQGNHDLSARTEQQASALQQTAATMEQLGSTVRHNSDSAKQAAQLAHSASAVAGKGGTIVGDVVQTMKGINDSSRRIADIIGTIDGIAFQTNILALNAAVEAARAGEQGRGFAVVAGEVRSLAQRSAAAAKEIKGLITASVERVDQGSALVNQAGQTMDEIVAAIRRVTDIVGEISHASVEQSNGVAQVGQAVTQMDQGTQQNAALVEESAAAAESLRQQAQRLVEAVSTFKLDHAGRAAG